MSQKGVIGGRATRLDAWDKVTGCAVYPGDLYVEGMLHAAVLRSPHPHARIRRFDLEAARALPGVVAVVTGDDIDGPNAYGLMIPDQAALARVGGAVRYVGDAVAAVAARTAQAAEDARASIAVQYELLPGVFDPRAALAPGAPLVHEERGANLLHEVHLRRGDPQAGFAAADVVVEAEYETPFIDHAYLQPEAGVARVDENGQVTVWVGTQWPHEDRRQIAQALGLPETQVRVVQMTTGGAFGGREDINVQIVLALLALKTRQPVGLVWERTDSIVASTKRHPFSMRYRTGARRDGRLTALQAELVSNAGAYASTSAAVLTTAVTVATGPYQVPNVQIDARCAYTNTPTAAAMRGFGSNQVNFAAEMQMGKLAEALGMDPVELRRRNLYRDGSTMHTGQVLPHAPGAMLTLEAAVKRAAELGIRPGHRSTVQGATRRGVGVACGFKNIGYNLGWDDQSTAVIELWPERAVVKISTCDVGQGSTTILAQMAATVLELPLASIQMLVSDTDVVPDSGSCSASRSTWLTGSAVMAAAAEADRKLAALGPNPPAAELPVVAEFTYHAPATRPLDPEAGPGAKPNFAYAYGAQVIEVEVDTGTGEVRALRAVAAHDVGRAINPTLVEGQIDGGLVMGQGYGMMEEHLLHNGKPQTTTLATFLMPTILDVPEIERVILETAEPEGPAGATGMGEIPMLPTPSAIAAAIHDATGVWVDRLPCSPEAVLRAMGRVWAADCCPPRTEPEKDRGGGF